MDRPRVGGNECAPSSFAGRAGQRPLIDQSGPRCGLTDVAQACSSFYPKAGVALRVADDCIKSGFGPAIAGISAHS